MSSLCSMTGFGRAQCRVQGCRVQVEVRSVNHRTLDARIILPDEARGLEAKILDEVRRRFHRGRLEGRIELIKDETFTSANLRLIDEARFEAVLRQLKSLAEAHRLSDQTLEGAGSGPTLSDVLAFSDHLVKSNPDSATSLDEATQTAVLGCVADALDALDAARRREGEGIAKDLNAHLDAIAANLTALEELYPREQASFQGRLEVRVREALERFGVDLDHGRLAQEMVYYGERSDVSEEIQRAKSHLDKLRHLVEAAHDGEPRGKTIDFYLQELMREANTTASKSNAASLTDRAVAMKVSVEKMREQAANVE